MSKTFIATTVTRLLRNDDPYAHSAARINSSRIDRKKQDKSKFWRHDTVKISNPAGVYVIRSIMGAHIKPGEPGITKDGISLDYDAMDSLGVKRSGSTDNLLTVEPANIYYVLNWYFHHPDTAFALATKLGTLGAALGLLGVIISIIGLIT